MRNNYKTKITAIKGNVFVLFLSFLTTIGVAQSDYSVTPIPHQVYTASVPVQGTMDDKYSEIIPLTFNFDFFGNIYNQIVVSTNGYIDFRTDLANTISPWSFSTTIPNANFVTKNSILGSYHDLNNYNAEGTLTYAVVGSAPYRKFVVIFNNHSHYSCSTPKSSFQMVLYESLNIIDVQIIKKELCPGWNGGRAVSGIINSTGTIAFTPPNRNTGQWTALAEGWRYSRPLATNQYFYTKCDANLDGFEVFNLQVVQADLSPANPSAITFYPTLADAQSQTNSLLSLNYTNSVAVSQTIYASGLGQIKEVQLRVLNCSNDYDLDSVATAAEDLNNDGNLANDDTDGDGIPNFTDNDDDGDLVLTTAEYVFTGGKSTQDPSTVLDTDNDGILNYLDTDDDGDGVLTINEDYNGNNNPSDDDTNTNGILDYLESTVALGVSSFQLQNTIVLYPNPTKSILNIDNRSGESISTISVYSITGTLVKEFKKADALQTISISDLQNGVYFVKILISNQVLNYKFIKK